MAEEKRIVRECQLGKNGYAPIFADWRIQDKQLNPQQREAVLSVLNSRDFITGISGKGRAKLLCCMRPNAALMRRGKSCLSLLQHQRPRGVVLRKEGFENAETIAMLLASERLQEKARGAVWWVDEAGLMSCGQWTSLWRWQSNRMRGWFWLATPAKRLASGFEGGGGIVLI